MADQERGMPAELERRREQCCGALTVIEDSPSLFFFFALDFGTFTHPKEHMLPP